MSVIFYEQRNEGVYIGSFYKRPFPIHVHDVVEIVCLTAGSVDVTVDMQCFSLVPNDIMLIFPSVPHSYDRFSEDAQGLTMIFSPNTIGEFTPVFRRMSLQEPLVPASQVGDEMIRLISIIQTVMQHGNEHLKLGYLHLFLCYLFPCLSLQPMDISRDSLTSRAMNYICAHYTEPISLEIVAKAIGVSRIHLSHLFSQQLKINFCQYVNILRIDLACTLLRDPSNSISMIIEHCGYGNSRTFHRAFQAQCNTTPKQYQKKMLYLDE